MPITRCALNEILVLPTASTFEHSIIKLASYEHIDSWNKLCNSSWLYDRKPLLEENHGKNSRILRRDSLQSQGQESEWNITVLSIADLVQLAIRKSVGKLVP